MMETNPNTRYLIEYKSILLDIIEKYKTFERVNLAIFLKSFNVLIKSFVEAGVTDSDKESQQAMREKRRQFACSEMIKPERHTFHPKTGEFQYNTGYNSEYSNYDAPELESIFVEDITSADRREIASKKAELLDPLNRLKMVTMNPELPDGLMLKFRKCKQTLNQFIRWQI